MTIVLDQRHDGSLALYIDGDLQFDSRDEAVYHEALALPALALAERRRPGRLRALVCGGGDGLTARELLTSTRLARLDLVDYDPAVLALARDDLAGLNGDSLADPRLRVAVEDAWAFVARAVRRRRRYDLIVVDLTVPRDADGVRFQTVDWYARLARLLGDDGLLAVNGVSPSALPDAYWSIYQSLRAAGLAARPYRVPLPSFAVEGYGDDWGFVLASPRAIAPAELADDLPLAGPRRALRDAAHLRRLFTFPAAVAERRGAARPTRLGSHLLLHYLYQPSFATASGADWDALAAAADPPPPAPDDGRRLLPPSLQAALARPIGSPIDEATLFERVIDLMPALQRYQTREMIAAFLDAPARFLAAVDLPGLVERLLRRAAELPRRLVAELRRLRRALRAVAGDPERLLGLGLRVVTIVTLVVMVANLLYPDAVYGKGSTGAGGHTPGAMHSLSQPAHGSYDPRAVAPDLATRGGFRDPALGRGIAPDETGAVFPARRYRYYPSYHGRAGHQSYRPGQPPAEQPVEQETAYRLMSDVDILPDGQVAIILTDTAYLLLGDQVSTVIDQRTGLPLLFLERDPTQHWRTAQEIDRQLKGLRDSAAAKQAWLEWLGWLEFAPWRADDQRELENLRRMADRLERARFLLGTVPASPPPPAAPPVSGAVEVFSGVWMLPDGSGLALRAPEAVVFMDGRALYRDQARAQPTGEPYPAGFKAVVVDYLGKQVKDEGATRARLEDEVNQLATELTALAQDKAEYESIARSDPASTMVEYGTKEIPLSEALQRTNADIERATQQRAALLRQHEQLPGERSLAERVIASLGQ